MKNRFYLLMLGILFSVFITGCDNANNTPGQYENGVFVVNEGSFGNSNGELSFIKSDNSVYNNLYAASNSGLVLGDVFQSMLIDGGKAYLVINNSGKVEVVNINDLSSAYTIGGLSLPRYMVIVNGKGYISEWTSFAGDGTIRQVDLNTGAISDTLALGKLPEQMFVINNKILVANSGDTTLHLVNTDDMTKTNIGNVDYPKCITQTNDGNIWVLYTGKPGWSGANTDGGLLVLNATATSIIKNVTIGSTATSNPSQLATDGNNVYYEYLGNVYKMDKSATTAPAVPFITAPATYLYGLNYYAANNTLLVADAKNFSVAGVVKRYDATTGAMIDSVITGVGPNGFVFH